MSIVSFDPGKLERDGFVALASADVLQGMSERARAQFDFVEGTFDDLVQDTQMGDGGRYRFRRYSRFLLSRSQAGELVLLPLRGHSIHQSVEDNPLNGGVTRTFEPLTEELAESDFLKELLLQDAEIVARLDPELLAGQVAVGVHQVRIVATVQAEGKPAPEGIHRDSERFTFQHFWSREAVKGGEFVAYDQEKTESFRWLQRERLDSVLFFGTTWHSATPITCREGEAKGSRDIFLVDFDPA